MVADSFQLLAHPSLCTQKKKLTPGTRKEGNDVCVIGPSSSSSVDPSHIVCEAPPFPQLHKQGRCDNCKDVI